jgi:hypothetical protein
MGPLDSWVILVSLILGIGYTTFQAYRLAKWKETNSK